jgi:flagellar motor switch protein FliG
MKAGQPLPDSAAELPGLTKAAVLLLSLDPTNTAKVLKQLNPEQIEDVTREVASLQRVPENIRQEVLDDFYSLSLAHQGVREGGLEYARALLLQSMDQKDAERLLGKIQTQVQKTPFAFLQKAESENLLTFIQDEHPQTIALILCHMPHYKSSEILVGLPGQKQVEVIKRIANMEQTNPEVIREVEMGLESRLSNMLMQSTEKAGGVETVSEMLNLADRATEKTIMEALEQEDPDLVEEIRRLMFVFEDILLVNDKGIQAVLKEVDNDELSLALKTASEDLKEKVFSNMSARAAEMIQEDMEYMGPVRISDVENSQQRIVDIVRRLEDAGEIMITGRGGEGEMIV